MLNRVTIMGRLVRDAEMRSTTSGTTVVNASLAINRRRKGREDETLFCDVCLWGQLGENFVKFFNKGDLVYIEGRLTQDSWLSKAGEKRTKIKITATGWEFPSAITGGRVDSFDKKTDEAPF